MKKLLLIINPYSGKARIKYSVMEIISAFNDAGYEVTAAVSNMEKGRSIRSIAEKSVEYDCVVCTGGDGTLSETVNGVLKSGSKAAVGYIPMGSTNDSAANLAMPANPVEAAKAIASGELLCCDVGYYEGNYFTYVAAFGAFTDVSYQTPQKLKNTFGGLGYVIDAMSHMPKLNEPIHTKVIYDGGEIEDDFTFGCVSNSTSIAGMIKLNADTSLLTDGIFELLLIRRPLSIIELGDILSSILNKNFDSENVRLIHTSKATFIFDKKIPWTRDGESGGSFNEVSFENKHFAINYVKAVK